MNKLLLWGGGGAAILAYLLWPKSASAQPNGPPAPGPTPHWGPGQWPKTPFPATANANTGGGMRVRNVPNPAAAANTILGTVVNGQQVTVLQTGIAATDGSGGEWWQVQSQFGTGYTRAVDPTGYVNWIIPTTVTAGAFHSPHLHHRAAWAHAVQNGAHPAQVEALRRAYAMHAGGGKG